MLTLTRKAGECIRIGEDIRIVVREIKGRQVRLGIEAPMTVAVYREEIYQKIREEGEATIPPEQEVAPEFDPEPTAGSDP